MSHMLFHHHFSVTDEGAYGPHEKAILEKALTRADAMALYQELLAVREEADRRNATGQWPHDARVVVTDMGHVEVLLEHGLPRENGLIADITSSVEALCRL